MAITDDRIAARAIRYREAAAELRRIADQLQHDHETAEQLRSLADGWEELAASVEYWGLHLEG